MFHNRDYFFFHSSCEQLIYLFHKRTQVFYDYCILKVSAFQLLIERELTESLIRIYIFLLLVW